MAAFKAAVLAALALAAGSSPSRTPAAAAPVAVPAKAFLESIGICCHIGQGIDDPVKAGKALAYIGAHAIRDDASTAPSFVPDLLQLHRSTGVKVILTRSGPNETALGDMLDMYRQLAHEGAALAVEGPNEPNNWPVTFNGKKSDHLDSGPIADWMASYYAQAKADPVLGHLPVFHSSESGGSESNNVGLQYLKVPEGVKGVLRPAGTTYATHANVHNYICRKPALIDNMAWINADPTFRGWPDSMWGEYGQTWAHNFTGYNNVELVTLPRVTTETGWVTSGGKTPLSMEAQGRLFLCLYLSQFAQGFAHTFVYMLRDDPGQGYWGFIHTNYTMKPSGEMMHRLTTVLADTGSETDLTALSAGLDYTIAAQPETMHDKLFVKSSGVFELAVWSERAGGAADAVEVDLGAVYSTVKVYDPTSSARPRTFSNVRKVPLAFNGFHAVVVEVRPADLLL